MEKYTGIKRYISPVATVPMVAMPFGFEEKGSWVV
jgi:hypothetical protein